MNVYLSEKLKVLSFCAMVLVVFLHSYNVVVNSLYGNIVLNKGYSFFIQDFFSQGITRIAVTLFFAISGYLFYLNIEGRAIDFILKIKKRIKTLMIPYLIWSLWGILFYWMLQSIPQSKPFFTNALIANYSVDELLITLFLDPIPYQLWFIRDLLLIIVLIGPLIYWLIKYVRFSVLVFISLWFFGVDFPILNEEALTFFVVGAFFSISKSNWLVKDLSAKYWIFLLLWIGLVLFKTILLHNEFPNLMLLNRIHKTSILVGLMAVWIYYDFLFKKEVVTNWNFYHITSFSFFLYAFHEPVLIMFKKGLFYLIGKSEFASLLVYITAPLVVIALSIFISFHFKRILPKAYDLITGGR
ncbi:MAG: hypothetical protein K0R51_814 [Cytophagaceae bacterium]|nr:hypothetical protein [Cytophagaceae bacterium]